MNINYNAQFLECSQGFIDSIYVLKKAFPAQSLYKQEDLARDLLNIAYKAHNAMEDVKILGKLVSHTTVNANELTTHRFPPTVAEIQH